jgi:ABC-type oligopeptide transport system substrate-binding subunit
MQSYAKRAITTGLFLVALFSLAMAASAETNAWGVKMPADAAPLDQQFVRLLQYEGTTADFAVSVYKRGGTSNASITSTPFVIINKNFELLPSGALSYDASKDGKTWTFHMDPALKWSDGNPVIADDVVFTFQYQADPKHAWDFAWFWSDIVNWDEAVAGKVPVTAIGVKKIDNYTVQFTTTVPSPYFPSKAIYVRPLSKVAFQKYGEYYNNDPKTSVSSSPWILTEWTKGKQMVFGPNKKYTGKLKPLMQYMILEFGDMATEFNAYRNNEVDECQTFSPADIATIAKDSQLNSEYHPSFGDFRTYYLGFDTTTKPFNDLRVRQAVAKAVDRESIIKNVVGRQGMAAYSFLMPGFPDSNSPALKNEDVNKYDVAAAQKLLSDAGYPGGKGFPRQQLWLRNENSLNTTIGQAIAAMLKDNLGIDVEVSNQENKVFMTSLNAHTLPFYFLSYGFDYLDPSNMLGIWASGGRHAWTNAKFDALIKDATSLSGNQAKRDQEFKDAEKILVDDVGGVFVYHATPGNIYKPYLKGSELEPDKTGIAAWHWPNLEDVGALMSTIYVSNSVPKGRKQ